MSTILNGVRILDLTTFMSGPYASMVLGDLGADVIKIEPRKGDNSRNIPPHHLDGECLYYLSLNRNKRGMTLNLASDEGRKVFYDLVREADIVFDNYRPGVTKKLGIDYDSLTAVKPDIIACSISAFGQDSPYGNRPAYDLTIQAISGAMSLTGTETTGPLRLGVPMGDLAASLWAVIAMLGALAHRRATGQGQRLDISLLESLSSLITYPVLYYTQGGEAPVPRGSGHQSLVPFNAYAASDTGIAVVCASDKFWGCLCDAIGHPEYKEDPLFKTGVDRLKNRDRVDAMLAAIFRTKTAAEWDALLTKHGVPCGVVNTIETVLDDPAIRAKNFAVPVQPGNEKARVFASPLRMSASPVTEYRRPPRLGEHNAEILRDVLHYDEAAIQALYTGEIL